VATAFGVAILLVLSTSLASVAYAQGIVHVVAPGDTLSTLALRYGVSVSAVAEANGLANPNLIHIGQRLVIPSRESQEGATTPPPSQGSQGVYIVQAGDTLYGIAQRHGASADALIDMNNLTNPNLLRVGQRLVLPTGESGPEPSAPPAIHTVRSGETLGHIAQLYGTSVGALVEANGLANPDWIYPGQTLVLPSGAGEETSWVEVVPSYVRPGDTVVIRVPSDRASAIQGRLGESDLRFLEGEDYHWALVGLSSWTTPGRAQLYLSYTEPSGGHGELTKLVRIGAADFPIERIYLPQDKTSLLDPEVVRQENARLRDICAHFTPERLWDGQFVLPLEGRTTSLYGSGRSYNGGPVSSRHEGLDIAAPEGTPVGAAARGRVVLAEELTVRGSAVLIDHGAGVYSGYYHLSRVSVETGEEVGRGQEVGQVGSTGLSTGAHLHWELRVGGVHISPLEWTQRSIPG
jgi:murein DD-endopeptidase MepM/ murein hydrolase activator NlpD